MKKETAIRRALLAWFHQNKRDLPWRKTKDPYKIWVSEIMLQQTRVEAVIPYYENFLQAFPTLHALAAAPEDRVLKLWEGLGYYSRARNLHKAAHWLVQEQGGCFPTTVEAIQSLPGIGKYTAGAIASIAFGIAAPALDGNVKRVLARLYGIEDWIEKASSIAQCLDHLHRLIDPNEPGAFNEAMMELGAQVCLPKNPACSSCPVRKQCHALALDRVRFLPARKPRKPIPHYEVVAAAIYKNGRYLLGKRPGTSMLAGLWEFPGGKVEAGETHEEAVRRELREELGIEVEVQKHLVSVDHTYTHHTVTLHLYLCHHIGGKPQTLYHSDLKWVSPKQFVEYPFPAANIKFFPYLKS
ncbi:MAG: A/G-specific adenine glycosylase [bacterium]|jgi:A/G-specific adenine glycosylase|nr:A/G-specific adenine glycosylase [bacterium]